MKHTLDNIKHKIDKMNSKQLDRAFISACKRGDYDTVHYLFRSPTLSYRPNIFCDKYRGPHYACQSGNLELVKFLVSPTGCSFSIDNYYMKESLLATSAASGHLDIVQYLLTDPELIADNKQANIHFHYDLALRSACTFKEPMKIVQYLLTSPELKEHSSINSSTPINDNNRYDRSSHSALTNACVLGNIELIKYLLTSTDLKEHAKTSHNNHFAGTVITEHSVQIFSTISQFLFTSDQLREKADVHAYDDYLFHKLIHGVYHTDSDFKKLSFLILNCGLEKTPTISNYINNLQINELKDILNNLFEKSQFHQTLNDSLPVNHNQHNKTKVKI